MKLSMRKGYKHEPTISQLLIAILLLGVTASCAKDSYTPTASGVATIPDQPGLWTYFSFRTGKVVGQAAVTDSAANKQWSERLDWDIAVSDGLVRTNGGSSGKGLGAIRKKDGGAYVSDRDTLIIE